MCGILGMHTTSNSGYYNRDADAFKAMLVLTSLRGQHSTGVFGVNRHDHVAEDKRISIVKAVGNPYDLFRGADSDEFFKRVVLNMGLVVGHCRYATRGAVNAANAHPFKEDNITLVHNGVIANYDDLRDAKKHKDITVDSHLIAKLFAEEGADEVLPYIQGAYVFVWYDNSDRTLHIARNSQRPLFYAEMEGGNNIFASEKETLIWNAQRHNYKIKVLSEIPTMRHLTFDLGDDEPTARDYHMKYKVSRTRDWNKSPVVANPPVVVNPPAKTDNVVNFRGASKRFRTRAADPIQKKSMLLVQNENEVSIEMGERLDVNLTDIDRNNNRLLLTCYHHSFPAVEFSAIIKEGFTDDQILEFDSIRGTVSSIYCSNLADTKTHVPWKIFLNHAIGVKKLEGGGGYITAPLQLAAPPEGEDDDLLDPAVIEQGDDLNDAEFASLELPFREFVVIPDTLGTQTRLSNDAFLSLASEGCGWCTVPITQEELAHPERLLLWRDGANYSGLVCAQCAAGYHKYAPHGE